MPKLLIIALLGAALSMPLSMAQMHASSPAGFGRGVGVSSNGRAHSHSFGPGAIFLGDPFYADYPVAPVTLPPQFVIAPPAHAADAPPEPRSEPLLIELQGNRYVRFGGRQQSAERAVNPAPDYAESDAGNLSKQPAQTALPPTVLIFRDGHREQVPEYAIVGGTIYASVDYWQSGHWTKNIQLSAINIPATIQANHEAGVRFTLPTAPNEVVTRP
jgi:hypothetical protein